MRRIQQPGPPAAERITACAVGTVPIERALPAGSRLLDTLAGVLAEARVESACLTLRGGTLGPFCYVMPALSPDGSQAAFYTAPVRPPGETRLDVAAITVGWRDGKPFFHCHALWTEAGGRRGCGHVIPDDTIIAAPIEASGVGIVGARFEVQPDPETGFNLFKPHPTGTAIPPGAGRGVALRLAPNQELSGALEAAAATAGFRRAMLHGGVASIIEARFMDAPPIEGFATELLVRRGVVASGATELDIAVVDYRGSIGAGRLINGDNPVLMTFEGVLAAA